jgi:hypothetical protein
MTMFPRRMRTATSTTLEAEVVAGVEKQAAGEAALQSQRKMQRAAMIVAPKSLGTRLEATQLVGFFSTSMQADC